MQSLSDMQPGKMLPLVIIAIVTLAHGSLSTEVEEEEKKTPEQLLKFSIPLGWGATELLDETDSALR